MNTPTAQTASVSATPDRLDRKIDFRLDARQLARLEQLRSVFGSRSAVIREAIRRLP